MSYDNDDYANDDWDNDNDEKSYQDGQKQLSEYDDRSSSDDEKKLKTHRGSQSSSQYNENEPRDELESTGSDDEENLMLIDLIPQKRKEQLGIEDCDNEENKQSNIERITSPFISKYEKAIVIGKRAHQISKNSPIYVQISEDELKKHSALHIAEMEFELGRIPMFVRRYLPDNTFEDWKLSELRRLPY